MKNPCNEIFLDIEAGGFKSGELAIITVGRGTGKSIINQYLQNWHMVFNDPKPSYKVLTTAIVDNAQWYTIHCTKDISIWFRETFSELEDKQWFENIDDNWQLDRNRFDMHEELYTMLQLRW